MQMIPFRLLFPKVAEHETLSVCTHGRHGLPDDAYDFLECYCPAPECDCRRVLFNVWAARARRHVATINHALDAPDPHDPIQPQTILDPMNPQSELSLAVLDLFMTVLEEEPPARLERPYAMVKQALRDPAHRVHHVIAEVIRRDPTLAPDGSLRPDAPCRCGSGRRFDACCGGRAIH